MSDFAVAISCILDPQKDNTRTSFVLDKVKDNTVISSSTITTHPIISGDMVADHMFNNPNEVNISGTFSLNGSKGILVEGNTVKLADLQDKFEYIKRNGILCDVVKVKILNENQKNEEARFKIRKNMVLTRISWTEKINSLDFSFSFTEALVAEVEELTVDISDQFAPNVTDPATLNFTDSLIDWNEIDKAVIQSLFNEKLITSEFLSFMQSMGATAIIALRVAAAVAIIIVTVLNCIPVIRQIITIVIAVVAVVAYGIYKAIKGIVDRHKYRIKQFKKYKDDRETKKEVERFCNFVGEIHKQLSQLNDYIKVYQVSSDEDQECMLTIDNNYYIFTFTKNNTSKKYSLVITDVQDKVVKTIPDISSALNNINECTRSNYVFRAAETGTYVYLFNPEKDKSKLTNYYIMSSSINMDEYNKMITDIIRNAMLY